MEQAYETIAAPAQDEFVEKRSRFIGQIAPVTSQEEAVAFLAEVRAQHREANHHCYAYALRGGVRRFSDDGEPSGTAGRPILEVLQREGLVDVAVVVTRYFGGILLGAGGLTRAYAQGANLAVGAARRVLMQPAVVAEVDVDYGFYGKLIHLLPQYRATVLDTQFAQGVRVTLLLRQGDLEPLSRALEELSAGTIFPLVREERMDAFPDDGG